VNQECPQTSARLQTHTHNILHLRDHHLGAAESIPGSAEEERNAGRGRL